MHIPNYFLSIDGGGTNCHARLYSAQGLALAESKAGPANARLGTEGVTASIIQASKDVLKNAGFEPSLLNTLQVGIGLAGILKPADAELFSGLKAVFKKIIINSDGYIACLGAHAGKDGAIIITGTGSSAMSIIKNKSTTTSAWGFNLSDLASGAYIGKAALQLSLQAHDGLRQQTSLSNTLMNRFNQSPLAMLEWSEQALPADYAALAPLVINACTTNDNIALEIKTRCCNDMLRLIDSQIKQGAQRISLVGGLAPTYYTWLQHQQIPQLQQAHGDPLDGALLMIKNHTLKERAKGYAS
jgi:glucosamine kinase